MHRKRGIPEPGRDVEQQRRHDDATADAQHSGKKTGKKTEAPYQEIKPHSSSGRAVDGAKPKSSLPPIQYLLFINNSYGKAQKILLNSNPHRFIKDFSDPRRDRNPRLVHTGN